MRISIRSKLISAILLPILAVYLSVLAINYSTGREQARAQAERHLTEMASHHATRLDGRFMAAEQAARAIANVIVASDPIGPPQQHIAALSQRVLGNPALYGALIVFEPGVVRVKPDPAAPRAAAADTAKPSGRLGRYVYRVQPPRLAPAGERSARAGTGGAPRREPGTAPKGPARGPAGRGVPARLRKGTPLRRGDLVRDHPDFHAEPWYDRARREKTAAWSEPRVAALTGQSPVARFTVPLVRDEQFLGAVAFDLSVQRFCDYVHNTRLEGGHCMLVSAEGLLVAHPSEKVEMRRTLYDLAEGGGGAEMAQMADTMLSGASGVAKLSMSHDGRRDWVVFSPVASPGWSFAAVIPEQRITDPVDERLRSNTSIMLGGLGIIIAMVLVVSIRVTRPIAKLALAVRAVAGGDLDARAEGITSGDEIGEFADAFNSMMTDLKGHVAALTDETAARQAVESELRVARDIQKSLLPRTFPPYPDRSEFDLHALVVPAKQVAGDFFDFFFVDDDVLALLIADVSGKGAPAAIFMAMTRTVIRDKAVTGVSPADVLTRVNHVIADDNDRAMFVTVFFAHYNTRSGELTYANAGHNPPCIGAPGSNGGVRRLEGSTGPILGVFEGRQYTQRVARLDPGQSLVLYTDGVTEALDAEDRQFSLQRFERIVAQNPDASPEEITHLVIQTVEQYRSHPQQDDMALLALRRNR